MIDFSNKILYIFPLCRTIVRLEIDEIAKLLDAVEEGDNLTKSQKKYHNKTKIRDLAILTLLLGTGIRV